MCIPHRYNNLIYSGQVSDPIPIGVSILVVRRSTGGESVTDVASEFRRIDNLRHNKIPYAFYSFLYYRVKSVSNAARKAAASSNRYGTGNRIGPFILRISIRQLRTQKFAKTRLPRESRKSNPSLLISNTERTFKYVFRAITLVDQTFITSSFP